jgi:CheY-like chemotaxis protein
MDVQMPEMDGYEATRRIRAIESEKRKKSMEFPKETPQSERPRGVPILAMTANVFREDIKKCLESGMDDHIGKPLDFDVVIGKLHTYLSEEETNYVNNMLF